MSFHSRRWPILGLFLLGMILPLAARPSPPAHAGATTLFSDGFESGSFSAWTTMRTGSDGAATVQAGIVKGGTYAAHFAVTASAGSYAYVRQTLAAAQTDLTASGDFLVAQEGAANNQMPIFRLYNASGALMVALYRQNQDQNQLWLQDAGGQYFNANATLPLNAWGRLDLHVVVTGTTGSIAVSLNGTQTFTTTAATIGPSGVQTVQIGTEIAGQAGSTYADNIILSTASAAPTPSPTAPPTVSPTPVSGASVTTLIQNGSFEQGGSAWLAPWVLLTHGSGAASIAPDSSIRADGATSAAVTVTTPGASTDVQLVQGGLTLFGGTTYILSFFAQAALTGTVSVALELGGNPAAPVWSQIAGVGPGMTVRWSRSLTTRTPPL